MRYEFTTYTILDSRDVLAGVCTRRVRCRGLLTPKGAVHATRRGSVQQEQGVFPAEEGSCRCSVWWRESGDLDRQETAATITVQTVTPLDAFRRFDGGSLAGDAWCARLPLTPLDCDYPDHHDVPYSLHNPLG